MNNFDILRIIRLHDKTNKTEYDIENSNLQKIQNNIDCDNNSDVQFCKHCGKQIDRHSNFCQYCGKSIIKEQETNITIPLLVVVIISFFIFSPITFNIQIMGIPLESKVSYNFIMQEAKFRIGPFSFDKEDVSLLDYINIKSNVINHFLLNRDISPSIMKILTSHANTEYRRFSNSSWYNNALTEYSVIENKKNNFFFENLFKSQKEKEERFFDIVKQLDIAAENVSNTYHNTNQKINETYARNYKENFNNLGFDIVFSEGDYYFRPYYPYLIKTFGIPRAWKEYLEITYARQNDFGEAYCKLNSTDLVNIILRYDKFAQEYSNFVYKDVVVKEQNKYLYSYLHGFDNELIFDYQTRQIEQNHKQSIENFLKEYPKFSKHNLVNEYYLKLKKNNYKINDSISNWLWYKLF